MTTPVVNIDPAAAQQLHADGKVILLDVREPIEWAAGHAPGARHSPLAQVRAANLWGVDVIVVCRSGARSGKVAQILADSGVPVRNMSGGMAAWQHQGLPLINDVGKPGNIA